MFQTVRVEDDLLLPALTLDPEGRDARARFLSGLGWIIRKVLILYAQKTEPNGRPTECNRTTQCPPPSLRVGMLMKPQYLCAILFSACLLDSLLRLLCFESIGNRRLGIHDFFGRVSRFPTAPRLAPISLASSKGALRWRNFG